MTVDEVLSELRKTFPRGHLRAEASATDADTRDDSESESSSYARITISRATATSAKSFTGLTLTECLEQARAWHKEHNLETNKV